VSGILRGDARQIPLRDGSVDLICTSPPYFSQRSYKDGGEHYDGQVGSEPHPREFLEALWAVMAECWRVLKPTGSVFVNLGDKRSGSSGPGTTSGLDGRGYSLRRCRGCGREYESGRNKCSSCGDTTLIIRGDERVQGDRAQMDRGYTRAAFGRAKSRQGLPERFVVGCEDGMADPEGIGWIYRQQLIWEKPNGLPESVRDRTRDNFEPWYHLVREGDYYSAMDELREQYTGDRTPSRMAKDATKYDTEHQRVSTDGAAVSPLGSIPGSVWKIPTEPLIIPEWLELDHFAAFPTEWPRRLILGFSPAAICLECGEGRAPVVDRETTHVGTMDSYANRMASSDESPINGGANRSASVIQRVAILGHSCACTPRTIHKDRAVPRQEAGVNGDNMRATGGTRLDPTRDWPERLPPIEYHLEGWSAPPTRPAVVLDPFGGTGTTAMVARALGRVGISLDLSADYCRLAQWRVFKSGHGAKVRSRYDAELQGTLL
jgi:hypothetical protein